MSKTNVRIENLQVNMRGVSPDVARQTAANVGQEVLKELSFHQAYMKNARTTKIENIETGSISITSGVQPDRLRGLIAERVAAAIAARLKRRL
jgi:hypothetical protein